MQTEYVVRRNVAALNSDRKPCKVALVLIKHENGFEQTICINEDLIRFAGESVIEDEVKRAAALPSDASVGNPLKLQ